MGRGFDSCRMRHSIKLSYRRPLARRFERPAHNRLGRVRFPHGLPLSRGAREIIGAVCKTVGATCRRFESDPRVHIRPSPSGAGRLRPKQEVVGSIPAGRSIQAAVAQWIRAIASYAKGRTFVPAAPVTSPDSLLTPTSGTARSPEPNLD